MHRKFVFDTFTYGGCIRKWCQKKDMASKSVFGAKSYFDTRHK